jgi:hypothetical protein
MDICALPTVDKRLLAKKVGNDLVKHHGKKRHYTVEEIKAAARRQNFPDTWDCWAMSLYSSPQDFAEHHARTGEHCDFQAMHNSMAEAVATDHSLADAVSVDHSGIVQAVHDWSPSHDGSWFDSLMDFFSNIDISFDFDFDFDP